MDSPSGQASQRGGPRKSRLKAQRIAPDQVPHGQFAPSPQFYNPSTAYNPQQFQQPAYATTSQQPAMARQPAHHQPSNAFNPNASQFSDQPLFNDPMASMAVQYGQKLAGQGSDIVSQKIGSYVSTSNLKYYFAVDTSYVWRKLGIILFPFTHSDWSIQYDQDQPVAPRYEVNSPDLYIPLMAFVTFVLTSGLVLGTHNRFSPEQLGMQASSSLGWLIIEILALLCTLYLMNINTSLKYLDLVALCGYKYVGMILAILGGLALGTLGYYGVLLWTSLSVAFFLVQTLRVKILPHTETSGSVTHGLKRRNYLLLTVAGIQPILMWWTTSKLVFAN